jgi:hypothetical protein
LLLQVRLYFAMAVAWEHIGMLVPFGTLFVDFILLTYLVLNNVCKVQVIGGQCSVRVESDIRLLPIVFHASLSPVLIHTFN